MIARGTFRSSLGVAATTLALSFGLTAVSAAQTTPSVFVNPRAGADDPRIGLKAGYHDAGDAKSGLALVTSINKPAVFDPPPPPPPAGETNPRMTGNGLTYANSDLAFQKNHVFMGNFYGITMYDVSDPAKAQLITTLVCPGGQGDVSVFGNLLFMSVEGGGRIDCGTQGIPNPPGYVPPARPAPGAPRVPPGPGPASPERIRGIRIFDISDIKNPKQVAIVQTCRGSHTHTIFQDPNDKDNLYVDIAGSAGVRPEEELAGCSGKAEDPSTALFTIVVIKVPIAHPEQAKVVNSPYIFSDPNTGAKAGLVVSNIHGETTPPREITGCHDITVFEPEGLAAGACSGNGILLDIKDPVHPKRIAAVGDPNFSFWHSANFSNDGSKLIFTDEWGGGTAPRCRATDPMFWGADTIFNLSKDHKLTLQSYFKMPAAQTDNENCVAHNGSIVPIPGRDIMVQAWYQGGVSVFDFTDTAHPVEIAYYDRGPLDDKKLVIGGEWSAYWYNGYIYGSEIARGLDVFKLLPSKYLTQNEIDAANQVHFDELNVQNQPRVKWPSNMVVAKAYIDQLARGTSVSADQLKTLSAAIDKKDTKVLKAMAVSLDKDAASAATPKDGERMKALAAIIK